ncbi:MAG: apolipoprotein N-acyltransferase [Bacteriovoracaceae bacterium]|nr:apolipoprotein N-acyltransferase [Bacteriovoracaceae bacterium]
MKYWPYILAPLSGAFYALAFPRIEYQGLFFLSPIALILMAFCLENIPTTKKRILAVLLHQTGFNLTGFYWVPHTLEEFGGLPPGASHALALLLAPVLNPQWWGWLVWMHFREKIQSVNHWTRGMHAFFGAVFLTATEMALPQQFPVFAGHVWMHFHYYLNLAPWGGVLLYSFFTWWLALGLMPILKKQRPSLSALAGVGVFFVLHFFVPGWTPSQEIHSINVRVVQANVGNFVKIQAESGETGAIEDVIKRYQDLTLKENPQSLDLVIWPETAYPFSLSSPEFLKKTEAPPTLFRDLIARTGAEMLIGGYDQDDPEQWDNRFETEYNAAFQIGIMGEFKEVYRKHILIPFGETMPFGPLNKTLSKLIPAVSFFGSGTKTPIFKTRTGVKFVTPICYEILQTGFIAKLLNNAPAPADVLINLTNDSWYGETAEPFQHLFLAKWRALEFRRPIIRSTNTGITTVIYPDGSEGRRLLTGEKDVLDVHLEVPKIAPQTIYQTWGNMPLVGLWIIVSLSFSLFWWLKIRPAKGRANVRLL